MSNPIIELITRNISDAIDAITVANGFNETLVACRPTRLGLDADEYPEDKKVVILQADAAIDEENSAEGSPPLTAWVQTYELAAFVINSDSDTDPIDTRINRVRSDIEKKLMEDVTRGGYAWDTRALGFIAMNDNPSASGVVVIFAVCYRTSETDPYS